jgi:RNA polymerase sigma factor (sigma-70 family)
MVETTIQNLQICLERLRKGDASARDELINLACARMTSLTRKMLNDYSRLRQWEQTDDIFQNSAMRLRRALEQVSPASVKEFFGLAALNIRRELRDLARHYYGRNDSRPSDSEVLETPLGELPGGTPTDGKPARGKKEGDAKDPTGSEKTKKPHQKIPARSPIHGNQAGGQRGDDGETPPELIAPDSTYEGGGLAQWTEFHKAVSELPEKDLEVVDLLFYHELTQEAAAEVLGVDKSTVKRRWRSARLKLLKVMQNTLPKMD